jgi:hypothetical protein
MNEEDQESMGEQGEFDMDDEFGEDEMSDSQDLEIDQNEVEE